MRQVSFIVSTALLLVGVSLAAVAPAAGHQTKPEPSKAAAKAGATPAMVNINTATAAQLETLPGIGARTAQAIIDHRQKNNGFKKIEELMNVKGLGEKSFLKLKPMVTVAAEKTDRAGDRQ